MTYDAATGTMIYRSKMRAGLKRNFQVMSGAAWLELLRRIAKRAREEATCCLHASAFAPRPLRRTGRAKRAGFSYRSRAPGNSNSVTAGVDINGRHFYPQRGDEVTPRASALDANQDPEKCFSWEIVENRPAHAEGAQRRAASPHSSGIRPRPARPAGHRHDRTRQWFR